MNYLNSLSKDNLSNYAHDHEHIEERVLTKEWDEWEMVDFHSIAEIPDSHAFLIVEISHDYHLVASLDEALAKLEHVHLHSTQIGVEVVTHKQYIESLSLAYLLALCWPYSWS